MARPKSRRRLVVLLSMIGVLLATRLPSAQPAIAASYRNVVAQVPAVPTSSETVRVWMDSDTAFGETAGLEYNSGASYVKVLGTYDTTYPGANWRADIPAQGVGTLVRYQLFTRNQSGTDYGFTGFNWNYTVSSTPSPIAVVGAKAIWLDAATIAWNGPAGSSYKLLYDPDGGLTTAAETAACSFPNPANPCFVPLSASGTVSGYPKNPNATGLARLTTGLAADDAKHLLQGQVVVAGYDGGGARLNATRIQIQSVLDALYAANAKIQTLGPTYGGGTIALKLWAPTAKSVDLWVYDTSASANPSTTVPGTVDAASGVWSWADTVANWDRKFYLFKVRVIVPSTGLVEDNLVTDPYSINLSQDGSAASDVRSQFVNLADGDLKPTGWDTLAKPALANFEDIAVYEVHVRDFSVADLSVTNPADRGTYNAFTYDGAGPHPNTALSDGMSHLKQLQQAGLTHVHLLPAFDIASVIEPAGQRAEPSITFNPLSDRASATPQAQVGAARASDGFNWGYDPYHYGAPEGSYSTNPDGVTRIAEFRDMVSALNRNGLRVVMDVVYNHTAASGQEEKSVLDKVVPGYYYRTDADGGLYTTSCCSDTASEYEMFEKLMIDTLTRWAVHYKVDAFRFDLMNFHTRRNMENVKAALQGLTIPANGVDGSKLYLYGEGWDFGSAQLKGFTNCTSGWCYAGKTNMTGSGIGAFNDIIRDAAHGGYSEDPLQIRKQGFINGLGYDWNGYEYNNRWQADLWTATDRLRSALRGSGADWNGQGSPFTDDPQEAVNYVEKHDNETLFDQNVFKLPGSVTMAERVRSQNLGTSLVGLAQGIPFLQMGSDILRSKSLDRNSYDSGDWFNKVFWDKGSNNFGKGLPPSWDNSSRWSIMTPLLANTALDPATSDMAFAAAHLRETLRIRSSSPLFRLTTEADVNARTSHYNTANTQDGLIVLRLSDEVAPDLDGAYENILVFFNANKIPQSINISGASGFALHPLHTNGVDDDPVIATATFSDATDTFTIPPRTTAVFVSAQAIVPPVPPSTLDWVGKMFPRGGAANRVEQGAFAPSGFDVFVRVYEAGVTEPAGQGAGISCALTWGAYGSTWTDIGMVFNVQQGNDDEYKATIPQATLNALGPGTYGFTAYCQKAGEDKKWKVDSYNINGVLTDDDQGDGLITVIPAADSSPGPAGGAFVHLFEWRWSDIEKECSYLAAKGYSAVQVSPPNEHLVPTANQGGNTAAQYPWWVRYQPVTHDTTKFSSRSGTWAEFQNMVSACNSLGVGIYVDAVINHMADIEVGSPPAGTSGTNYDANPSGGRFYGSQYQADDFHAPDCTISDYGDRYQVQSCKLSGLPDLNTGKADVQTELRRYLQALIDAGVTGFRVDGAKHMAAQDIAAIFSGLTGPFYVFQEVIDQSSSEPVRDWEYAANGDVTEFAYAFALGAAFDDACSGSLSDLQDRFSQGDVLPSRFAQVFTDNHDNQRGHGVGAGCVVDHRDGQEHVLANVFALAYPYGYPSVMSSFYWQSSSTDNTNDSYGPPTVDGGPGSSGATLPIYVDGDTVPDNCTSAYTWGQWACEHRRTATANMVKFRRVTAGEPVTWHTIGAAPTDHIALGLGDKGFVAINRTASGATTTYATGMREGSYCDVTKYDFLPATGHCVFPGTTTPAPTGDLIAVNPSGQITAKTLAGMDAFAIHMAARMVDTDYDSLPVTYGIPWHIINPSGMRLGVAWRVDDGVTRTAWTANTGSVNLKVTGAPGYVTAWFDWNQDGDFGDSGELAFANQFVGDGQTVPVTFAAGTSVFGKTIRARFRVYPTYQTLRLLRPDAEPQPSGGAAGGEVEGYAWSFSPLGVTLADFDAVQAGSYVLLTWETNSELDNRGFNLYRGNSPAGPDRQLNGALIPSQSQGGPGGFVYTWEDRADLWPGTAYYYWVEAVSFSGSTARYGPVSVDFVLPTAVKLAGLQASPVADIPPSPWAGALAALGTLLAVGSALARRRRL